MNLKATTADRDAQLRIPVVGRFWLYLSGSELATSSPYTTAEDSVLWVTSRGLATTSTVRRRSPGASSAHESVASRPVTLGLYPRHTANLVPLSLTDGKTASAHNLLSSIHKELRNGETV